MFEVGSLDGETGYLGELPSEVGEGPPRRL